jgi:hypothetical protein
MKKLKLTPVLAAGVAAAVQINLDQALARPSDTATYTTVTSYDSTNVFIPISPAIANADELISISEGSVTGSESATFTVTVDYSDSTQQQIYTKSGNLSFNLNTISDETFAEGTIDGLTLNIPTQTLADFDKVNIPDGTVFTFAVVPEPATLSLVAMGAAGALLAARRRAGKKG